MNLDELLAAVADETIDSETLGAQLAELDGDSLAALAQSAVDEFNALSDAGDLGEVTLARMGAIADARDAVRVEQRRRDAAAVAAADAVAALAQRMSDGDAADDEIVDTTPTPTDPDADPGDDDDDSGVDDDPANADAQSRELVNASGRRTGVDLAAVRSRTPRRPVLPARARAALIAAADVPGVPTGTRLDIAGLAQAAEARLAGFPMGLKRNTQLRAGIATIKRPIPQDLAQNPKGGVDDEELMRRAADQSRLPGGSLIAAGGWCAPSETVYDLCEPETTDGLVSVPELGIRRGGLRYAESPLFSDIYSGVGFQQTEAENIAETEKDCYEIGCPTFEEVRLDAKGVCITAGILQQRGYPEMVQRVIRGALTAHAHKLNAYVLARMAALSTAVTPTLAGFGAWADTLSALELQVVDIRYKYRLAQTATLELVGPNWLRPILRADLAVRNGTTPDRITDAALDQHFRASGVAPQWVVDWQDAFVNAGNTGLGGSSAALTWPTTAKVMLYPAGVFTKGVADIIQLDAIYDSVNIRTNNYTALFTEEGVLVAKRCMESRIVTLSELCAAGRSGAQVAYDCTP